jgi:hypothetical protein
MHEHCIFSHLFVSFAISLLFVRQVSYTGATLPDLCALLISEKMSLSFICLGWWTRILLLMLHCMAEVAGMHHHAQLLVKMGPANFYQGWSETAVLPIFAS